MEADETLIGNDPTRKRKLNARGGHHKHKVLALIDRTTGRARARVIENVNAAEIGPILRDNINRQAWLTTDEAGHYVPLGRDFADHGVVNHGAGEYGRGVIHTNTAEGYFSVFKRGMKVVYHTSASATYIATWASSSFGTTTGSQTAWTTQRGLYTSERVRAASDSRINQLTKWALEQVK